MAHVKYYPSRKEVLGLIARLRGKKLRHDIELAMHRRLAGSLHSEESVRLALYATVIEHWIEQGK